MVHKLKQQNIMLSNVRKHFIGSTECLNNNQQSNKFTVKISILFHMWRSTLLVTNYLNWSLSINLQLALLSMIERSTRHHQTSTTLSSQVPAKFTNVWIPSDEGSRASKHMSLFCYLLQAQQTCNFWLGISWQNIMATSEFKTINIMITIVIMIITTLFSHYWVMAINKAWA